MNCMRSAPRVALALTAVGSLLLGAIPASAEKSVVEEVLEILRDEGKITEERYDDLLERHRAEQAESGRAATDLPAVSAPGEPDPKGWHVKWDNGIKIDRNDGYHKIKIGGRIQNDWAVIHQDSGLVNSSPADGGSGQWITGTEFRRARLYVEGTLFEKMIFKAQYDFAGGEPAMKDVYVGMRELGPIEWTKVGHFKEPFSLEELTSSKYITFMERALPNVFSPSRNTGVGLQMAPLEGRMTWAVGGFQESDDTTGNGFQNNGDYHLTTRLTGLPWYDGEGEKLVHLGLSYSHQFWNNSGDILRYRQRPEMHMADRLVNTDFIAGVSDVDLFGPEFAWVCGPFSVQSEFLGALLQGDSEEWLWGIYAEASYFLTGEHRAYKTSSGAFDRVKPANNFDFGDGHWGAFQVAARYSYLDLDDGDIAGGKEDDMTLGLNWYLFPNARVSLNYVWGRVRGQGDVNGGQTRFQIDF